MPRLSLAFFSAGALCGLSGMIFGIVMAASGDHSLSPAHAHLNLVGWASLALMGAFYAVSGAGGRLGWINFFLSTLGVALMVPSLAYYLRGVKAAEPILAGSSILAALGMLTFVIVVLSRWKTAKPA